MGEWERLGGETLKFAMSKELRFEFEDCISLEFRFDGLSSFELRLDLDLLLSFTCLSETVI